MAQIVISLTNGKALQQTGETTMILRIFNNGGYVLHSSEHADEQAAIDYLFIRELPRWPATKLVINGNRYNIVTEDGIKLASAYIDTR